jgi:hypothetical protein
MVLATIWAILSQTHQVTLNQAHQNKRPNYVQMVMQLTNNAHIRT